MNEEKNDSKNKKYSNKCYFCVSEDQELSFKEVSKLKRFLNEREMIISRQKSRLCAYHQRKLTNSIKKARYLALLPVGGRRNMF